MTQLSLGFPLVTLDEEDIASVSDYSQYNLTDDQRRSVSEILRWLTNPDHTKYEHLLEGYAGTGKTTLVQAICSFLQCVAPELRIGICAYSNNAKNVVRRTNKSADLTIDTMTCCQMLGARMGFDGDGKVNFRPTGNNTAKIWDYDLIIVDEAYGIDSQMYEDFSDHFGYSSCQRKILYVGDPAQTGPIGELHSPVAHIGSRSSMTEVRRHDGPILNYVTAIRNDLGIVLPYPESDYSVAQDRGLWVRGRGDWKNIVGRAFSKFHELDPWDRRIFCFTNDRVKELNELVRSLIYKGHQLERFMPRERILFKQPYGDTFCISDEATVINVEMKELKVGEDLFDVYAVTIEHEDLDGEGVRFSCIPVLAESSLGFYNKTLKKYEADAKSKLIKWEVVKDFKDSFAWVDYAYTLTTHTGKGATCRDAFVDVRDMRKRLKFVKPSEPLGHIIEYNRLVYTAATRAADRLFMGV
jgi:exodeoxyribonuclease-5